MNKVWPSEHVHLAAGTTMAVAEPTKVESGIPPAGGRVNAARTPADGRVRPLA